LGRVATLIGFWVVTFSPCIRKTSQEHTSLFFFNVSDEEEKVLTDFDTRYQQILFPALRLCQALLSSLGSANRLVILMSFSMGKLTKIAEG
jgi:hypothetical protein